jgi:hypothetical protein
MGVTVKVNGSNNGLIHKGSGHKAKCTAPDVCKTPSPGGPVPVPYPMILSKSSDLKGGTTTVKADGGQMIAVKGSEYATCNGDEAGTAGGVVSSTNMKEAKFILFSFDVKMDGKNACRNNDKMTMNHQNTICMLGSDDETVEPEPFEISVDCDQKRNNPKKGSAPWTRCMCQQLCAAIAIMEEKRNLPPEEGGLKKVPGARNLNDYATYKEHYKKAFMKKVDEGKDVDDEFIHPCAACEYNKLPKGTNPTTKVGNPPAAPFNAGHTHEAAWGGNLKDLSQFKMMDSRVNMTIKFPHEGARKYDPEGKNKGQPIQAKDSCNCPDGPAPHDEGGCSRPEKTDPDDPYIDLGGEG